MPRRRTPRLTTFDYLGHYRYFWTICAHNRQRVFTERAVVETVRLQFLQASETERVAVLAYCFMPDHLHLLIEGLTEDSNCEAFIRRAKQASGYWFKRQHGARLWQKTSWDRVLRSDEDTRTVTRYILDNPVRAGLVAVASDYPFSGSLARGLEDLLEFAAG